MFVIVACIEQNIFIGEDIRKQMPGESGDFDALTDQWIEITGRMFSNKKALVATHYPGKRFVWDY